MGAGKDRDGKKAKPAPSWTEGPAKPSGQRRLWGTDESGSRRRAFPPHRLVLESPLRANRGVPIVREPRSPRGWGWGVGSFRVITAVFFLFLLAQLPPGRGRHQSRLHAPSGRWRQAALRYNCVKGFGEDYGIQAPGVAGRGWLQGHAHVPHPRSLAAAGSSLWGAKAPVPTTAGP